ncbi:MAG: hypothetical protein AAF412_03640 [Pseudomonadota bacterium]
MNEIIRPTHGDFEDVIRMYASYVSDIIEWHHSLYGVPADELRDKVIMEFPIIQGTHNQNVIHQIGSQEVSDEVDYSSVVKWMLKDGE